MKKFSLQDREALVAMFRDYYAQYRADMGEKGLSYQTAKADGGILTFSDKEAQLNAAIKKEVAYVSGVPEAQEWPLEVYATHPIVSWATFAIVNQLIDAVLPDSLVNSIGLYTDIINIDMGDSASFDIEPRDLFVVSKAGHAMRQGELKKQFKGQVSIIPEARVISVTVSLYKVLSGMESLARFTAKAVQSLESEATKDAYTAFATAMAALDNAGTDQLRYAGWSQANFLTLAQRVSAWNGGRRAMLVGTSLALQNVLPADANYRYDLESDFVRMGYIRNFKGYDVMEIPQVADWATEFSTLIDDTKLWVLSPSAGKLVKLVLEGSTLASTANAFDNANLTQETNLIKMFASGIATSALAGTIELS